MSVVDVDDSSVWLLSGGLAEYRIRNPDCRPPAVNLSVPVVALDATFAVLADGTAFRNPLTGICTARQ